MNPGQDPLSDSASVQPYPTPVSCGLRSTYLLLNADVLLQADAASLALAYATHSLRLAAATHEAAERLARKLNDARPGRRARMGVFEASAVNR